MVAHGSDWLCGAEARLAACAAREGWYNGWLNARAI